MCYNVKKMCRKSSPFGEGPGEGPPGKGEGPALQLDTNSKGIKAENNN